MRKSIHGKRYYLYNSAIRLGDLETPNGSI